MAAHREKVDLSDDPMASLFEDDFIPESKKPVAKPVRAEAEEPALVSLNFDKVALKGQQKKAAAAVAPKEKKAATTKGDEVVREDLHGDDVRMGLGVDFSSLAPAVRVNALGDVETSRDTAGDVFGVKADPAPRDDLFDDLPEVEPQGVAIRAPTANDKEIEDMMVGKLLEREDFSGVETSESLFGASSVKQQGRGGGQTSAGDDNDDGLNLDDDALFDNFDAATTMGASKPVARARAPAPAAPAPEAPKVDDTFDFASYIESAGKDTGGGLFD